MDRSGKLREVLDVEQQVATVAPGAAAKIADSWRTALANVQSFSIDRLARFFVAVVFAPYFLAVACVGFVLRRALLRTPRKT